MNIFFGKISKKKDIDQINDGYYQALKGSSWFNGIKPGDYSYIIGDGKIQLWKAKEWSKKNQKDVLKFEIIHRDLGINTKQLASIKYFKVSMELVVLTVRSTAKSARAFFPIEFDAKFSEEKLKNLDTYKDKSIFRNIHILGEKIVPNPKSEDLQLYKKDAIWKLYKSDFITNSIISDFQDNTHKFGGGQTNKDKTIDIVIDPKNEGQKLAPNELSILQIYDLFCCPYQNKEISEIPGVESDSGYNMDDSDELDMLEKGPNIILYGPPGTGKTLNVLNLMEELDTNEKYGVPVEYKGNLSTNKTFWHLAPGERGSLWDVLKKGKRLGYEWCKKSLGDLHKLNSNVDNYQIKKRFSEVKKGDYFCIISGRQCLAIAIALEDYVYTKADHPNYDFQTIEIDWLAQFDTPILMNSSSTKSFTRVGMKRWEALHEGLKEKGFSFDEADNEEVTFKKLYKFTTFHQSYSYEDFIEGIKPRLVEEESEEEIGGVAEIEYEIKPGVFYSACDKAAQLAGYSDLSQALKDTKDNRIDRFSKAQPYYLIIDEINRGNVANIFGELITLIESDKRLGGDQETIVSLPYSKDYFGVPGNLILIGTMNTADRSIEALDSALRRRFTFVEKPPRSEIFKNEKYKNKDVDLGAMLDAINGRIELLLDKDHLIGHSYFMGVKTIEDMQSAFKNKVIPLLEEYFYGKPQYIGMILGPGFLKEKGKVKIFNNFKSDFIDFSDKKTYEVIIPETWDDYRKIYEIN